MRLLVLISLMVFFKLSETRCMQRVQEKDKCGEEELEP